MAAYLKYGKRTPRYSNNAAGGRHRGAPAGGVAGW